MVWKPLPYKRKVVGGHLVTLARHTKHDSSSWLIDAEVRGESIDAIILRAKENTADLDSNPAEYTLALTTYRINPEVQKITTWHFTGVIKPGCYFRLRLDAILENLGAGKTHQSPCNLYFSVRVRDSKSVQVENYNTANAVLKIAKSYELVSKEIMALKSAYFKGFFYGGPSGEGRYKTTVQLPVAGEFMKEFELAMSLMLEWIHHKSLKRVTPVNAHMLILILHRYRFTPIFKLIDSHVADFCQRHNLFHNYEHREEWDAAFVLCTQFNLPKTEQVVFPRYTVEALRSLVSKTLIERLICRLRRQQTIQNCSHVGYCRYVCLPIDIAQIFFAFKEGRVVVQLNRVGYPKSTLILLRTVAADPPVFEFDGRDFLSVEPVAGLVNYNGEDCSLPAVPADFWALMVVQNHEEGGYHFLFTKRRPIGNYLGFVVSGEPILTRFKDSSVRPGLHFF